MSRTARRRVGFAALLLGLAVLYIICLLTALHTVGTDDALYFREQTAANVLPSAGISEEELRLLDSGLARYLAGDESALEESSTEAGGILRVEVFGQTQPAFNEKEMTHMRDCYALFALLRKVRSRLIPWAVLLIAGGAYLLQDRRRVRLSAWLSPLVLLLPLGAFALWAALDFNAAFNFFHRLLFTNDLWLLDPRTDLLIRVCPQSMFMHMGLRIAGFTALALFGVPAVVVAITFIWPRGKEENTWNNRTIRRGSAQKRIDFGRPGTR